MNSRLRSAILSSVESKDVGKFQNSSPVIYGKDDAFRLGIGATMGGKLGDSAQVDDGRDVSRRFDRPSDRGVDTAGSGLDGGHEWRRLLKAHQVLLRLSSSRDMTLSNGTEQAVSFIQHDVAVSWADLSALLALSGSPSAFKPVARSTKA